MIRSFLFSLVSFQLAVILTAAFGQGCKQPDHEHAAKPHEPQSESLPARSVTVWTGKTELFMEYEPPTAGREGKFAAHLTELSTFKPLTAGTMTLVLKMSDGTTLTSKADQPSSPGIFRALIRPAKAGKCSLAIAVRSPQATDDIDAGPCEIFADLPAAIAASGAAEGGGKKIVFTKEQQWKTEFATAAVAERELQPSVQANAEIRPIGGKEARLTAAATGRVMLAMPIPTIGMKVKAGQILATISPRLSAGGDRASLDADVRTAQAELLAAETQLARVERLFKEQAVPQRNVEDARARVSIAQARLAAGQGRLDQYSAGAAGLRVGGKNTFQVRSPIDGTLVTAAVASGEGVEEGRLLFTVMDLDRVWLVARVFEPDIPKVEGTRSAWFTIDGYDTPFAVDETNGKLVTVGRVVDPQNRTVPVIFEVANPAGKLRVGQFAKVGIATGKAQRGLAVPDAAILDDGGNPVVYVQVEGESFERRALALGVRSLGYTGVREGLSPGEHVVTQGAYEIKLTAASGVIPQHGHVH
jgi:membrane fusion protein, heavy metal efflux system